MNSEQLEAAAGEDYVSGKVLLIDKPLGWSSFDVVKKVRFLLKKRFGLQKLKVGHAGTLDPLATGLLVLCTGKYTKRIETYMSKEKCYTGTFMLGATTASYDLESPLIDPRSTEHLTAAAVQQAAALLAECREQVPPAFSAKYVDGKRAYEAARKGQKVALAPQAIRILNFKVDCSHLPLLPFELTCSKGTYVRALARDLGELLGVGAYLHTLRRTASGELHVADALTPAELEQALWPPQ